MSLSIQHNNDVNKTGLLWFIFKQKIDLFNNLSNLTFHNAKTTEQKLIFFCSLCTLNFKVQKLQKLKFQFSRIRFMWLFVSDIKDWKKTVDYLGSDW